MIGVDLFTEVLRWAVWLGMAALLTAGLIVVWASR